MERDKGKYTYQYSDYFSSDESNEHCCDHAEKMLEESIENKTADPFILKLIEEQQGLINKNHFPKYFKE